MRYNKPPLSFEQQADLLLRRGMAGDRTLIEHRLQSVSYYRLSGYSYTFRQDNPADPKSPLSDFKPGTTFDEVWARYAFDRRLRLLVMDAVERIEIAVRAQIATLHASQHGLFAYSTDPASLPNLGPEELGAFLDKMTDEQMRSKDAFVKHFANKYGDTHDFLPVWMASEIMSFGTLLTLHRGCHPDIRRGVALPFGVHDRVFASWLLTLNTVRNICAHHGRLWNRQIGTKPKIPDKLPAWNSPVQVGGDRMFAVLTICKWCLDRIAPQSAWSGRFRSLVKESPLIPLRSMGFPDDWENCPIW